MAKEKPVEEMVEMTDSRIVAFVGKRKMLKESLLTEDNKVQIRLDFRNGETRTFTVPASLLLKFAAHGAEQKLGDETAGEDDLDDMVLAVDELMDRLNKGEWTTRVAGSGMSGTSVLAKALVEQTGKTIEQIKAFLKDKTQAQKNALRNNPRIKPIVERLEAEKASKSAKVDTDALLDELEVVE